MKSSITKRAKKQSLLSYFFISVLPVTVCSLMLLLSSRSAQIQKVDASLQSGLNLYMSFYQSWVESMDACANHILGQAEAGESGETITEQLQLYKEYYSLFDDIVFFQRAKNTIYTTDGVIHYSLFEQRMKEEFDINLTSIGFYTALSSSRTDKILGTQSAHQADEQELSLNRNSDYIIYLKTLPVLSQKPAYSMAYLISAPKLYATLEEYIPSNYTLYSCSDPYCSLLLTNGKSSSEAISSQDLEKLRLGAVTHRTVNGTAYVLLRVCSPVDGIYHMVAYRSSDLYGEINSGLLQQTLLYLGIVLLTGACAFLLHRYMYSGIDRLFKLPLPDTGSEKNMMNPVLRLSDSVENVLTENNEMKQHINRFNQWQNNVRLLDLLYGNRIHLKDTEDVSQPLIFPHPFFSVAYLNYSSAEAVEQAFSVDFQQITTHCLPLRTPGTMAVIMNHESVTQEEMILFLSRLAARVGKPLIGVGLPQNDISLLTVSFFQAQVAVSDCTEENPICYCRQTVAHSSILPLTEKDILCQYIIRGDAEGTELAVKAIQRKMEAFVNNESLLHTWYLFLTDAIRNLLQENNLPLPTAVLQAEDLLCVRGDELANLTQRMASDALQTVLSAMHAREERSNNQILAYIEEHFLDESLSSARVANCFGVSESGVGQMMKQTFGKTFNQYIADRRMEYICSQLLQTNRPIKDIIREGGYLDAANFTRKFRSLYQCTPTEYRKNNGAPMESVPDGTNALPPDEGPEA